MLNKIARIVFLILLSICILANLLFLIPVLKTSIYHCYFEMYFNTIGLSLLVISFIIILYYQMNVESKRLSEFYTTKKDVDSL